MLILGWHGGWQLPDEQDRTLNGEVTGHDAAAVLLNDGRIVAAIEEERLSRVKHSRAFPERAIRFCLEQVGASMSDVDIVATDTSEEFMDAWVLRQTMSRSPTRATSARQQIEKLFAGFGANVSSKLHFCRHHLAHLYSSWVCSGFPSALGVVLDAAGDGPSGLIGICGGNGIEPLRYLSVPQSLGYFYVRCINLLGYELFDEYKVMGLAPYGDPSTYRPLFAELFQLQSQGRYSLVSDEERLAAMRKFGALSLLRDKDDAFEQKHSNFAAALQEALETIGLHVVTHFQRATGARRLCLAGGVAHNCTMNGRIIRSGLFEEVFIQPASHDAGNALGAALSAWSGAASNRSSPAMQHVYLGTPIGTNESIEATLRRWRPLITFTRLDDAPAAAAKLLADGDVIAWVQGRSEFGPRALGNRSILADARPAENKRIINEMVKKREGYRPFAPAVIREELGTFFEVPERLSAVPFMVATMPVRPEMRAMLGAVTHVDGSARVQSVDAADNPRFHALIAEFGKLTNVPVVLNTSFNNNAEPIVDSVDDAVTCFLTTGIQRLIVGDWLVEKMPEVESSNSLLELRPRIAEGHRLVSQRNGSGNKLFLETAPGGVSKGKRIPISAEIAALIDGSSDDSARLNGRTAGLITELFELWQKRALELHPEGV
jgi:carbamoyltransferase